MLENTTDEERDAIISIYHEKKQKKIALAKQLSKARSSVPIALCDQQKQILENCILDENTNKEFKMVSSIYLIPFLNILFTVVLNKYSCI